MKLANVVDYWWQASRKSASEALGFLTDQKLLSLAAMFVIGLLLYMIARASFPKLVTDWGNAMDRAVEFVIFSIASVVVYGVVLFAVNLFSFPVDNSLAQDKKIIDLGKEIKRLRKEIEATGPNFHGDILMYSSAEEPKGLELPTGLPAGTVILFNIILRNSGDDSLAEQWATTVRIPGKSPVPGITVMFDPGIQVDVGLGEVHDLRYYPKEELLPVKGMTAIKKGSAITGVLAMHFPGLTRQDIHTIGTEFTIRFCDINGKFYSMTAEHSGTRLPYGRNTVFPGARFPSGNRSRPGMKNWSSRGRRFERHQGSVVATTNHFRTMGFVAA